MGVRRLLVVLAAVVVSAAFVDVPAASASTTYTWVGNTKQASADNHSWGDERNWDPEGVPADGDSVIIAQPSADDCAAHVDGAPTVTLENFTLSESPSLCTTSVTGGAISVTTLFQWTGGKLDTPTTIAATATALVNPSERLNSLTQDLHVFGSLQMPGSSGTAEMQIAHGRTVHIEPAATLLAYGTAEIDGNECCTDPAKVRNEGTISVAGGTLTVATAELDQLDTVTTSLGGRLVSTAGPVTTGSDGHYTGNGRWLLAGGVSATFSGTQTLGGDFHLELGGLTSGSASRLAGTVTLAGAGTFDWTGGIIVAKLTLGHTVATVVAGAHLGGGQRVVQGIDFSGGQPGVPVTLVNHGTFAVTNSATIATAQQARLTNASDGTMSFAPGTGLSSQGCCSFPDRLTNAGSVVVTNPQNASGPVVFNGVSYRSSGTTSIASGRTLQLSGGAPNLLPAGSRIGGSGRLVVMSPTAVSGTVTVGGSTRLTLADHGTLDGRAQLSGSGSMTWSGGAMSGDVTLALSRVAISGTAVKRISNVGGGSTSSVVRITAPTTVAAGTATAHDVINLGHSTLVLAAATRAGAFADFQDGQLVNRGALSIGVGRMFATTFTQGATGRLIVDVSRAAHGQLQVATTATAAGSLSVRNSVRPALGARVVVLVAHSLSSSLSCVTTSGTGATGTSAGHWAPVHNATKLPLVWRSGAHTHC